MAVFLLLRGRSTISPTKRTAVCVDGFNFYYGRLKGTEYKWLDIFKLAQYLLNIQDPSSAVEKLMFFSAPILGRYARHGAASQAAQTTYWQTLTQLYPGQFEVIKGEHQVERKGTTMKLYKEGHSYQESPSVKVHFIEEKKTDVNLALHLYRTAASGHFDQLVVFSNDRDIEPALELISQDFPTIIRGVVFPLKPEKERPPSGSLQSVSDWVIRKIHNEALERCLLPPVIHGIGRKGHVLQPAHWKPQIPLSIGSHGTPTQLHHKSQTAYDQPS